MNKFLKHSSVLVLTAAIVIVILTLIQPFLYKKMPSDFNRHLVVYNALTDHKVDKEIVFFGDSRCMFGVNTKKVKEQIGTDSEVINISSVGQSIYESSYYYDMVDSSTTKVVVQCMNAGFFSKDIEFKLQDSKAISMFLSGYRKEDINKELLPHYHSFFDQSEFACLLDSRVSIRTYIHNLIRPLFDKEKFDESKRMSLYFPHIYISPKHYKYPSEKYSCKEYAYLEEPIHQYEFVKECDDFFKKKGIDFYMVIMPLNPDLCKDSYDKIQHVNDVLQKKYGLKTLNIASMLSPEFYYDALHANKAGAELITKEIADYLKEELKTVLE